MRPQPGDREPLHGPRGPLQAEIPGAVQPICRYERASPGELLHIDTKRLGRIQGVGHRITGDRTRNATSVIWSSFVSTFVAARPEGESGFLLGCYRAAVRTLRESSIQGWRLSRVSARPRSFSRSLELRQAAFQVTLEVLSKFNHLASVMVVDEHLATFVNTDWVTCMIH
jgi:hypothetical protein